MRPLALVLALLAAAASPAAGQHVREIEFRDQPVTDILLALAAMAGTSIVPDETVTGSASWYFAATDFDTALQLFLSTYKMHSWKVGDVYFVSRVRAQVDAEGNASVDADEVDLRLIVRALSRAIGKTILFDALPREALTVHAGGLPPSAVLEILVRKFPDYAVEAGRDYYYLRKVDPAARGAGTGAAQGASTFFTLADGLYSLDVEKARFRDLLVELFRLARLEYSLFLRTDVMLENLHFRGKTLEQMLRLVMEQASADYTLEAGVYYVYDIQRTDVLKKLKTVRQVRLSYLAAQDLPALFPPELASQALYRLDRATNSILLVGSPEEIDPIEEFLRAIDRPVPGLEYRRYDLSFLKVSDLAAVLPAALGGTKPIPIPQTNSFVMPLSAEGRALLEGYLPLVDRRQPAYPIRLRYIQAETLVKNLPPSVAKEDLLPTADATLLFFTGTEEKRKLLLGELALVDRPAPQIRYELLVVQYQDGEGADWKLGITADRAPPSAPAAFIGSIGRLLNLNFNIVSTFGYLFALELNLGLTTNRASILADTSLTGLSGQEIRFQNTETSRYREIEVDPDTGEQRATGVTREISTGLIIGMNGWVSGDGMITMKVTSTVSKQGTAESGGEGTLPTTSEKVVSTNVRTPSGTPVVIGGLIQQNADLVEQRTPILGDIPLLGMLFRTRKRTLTTTELVIYIVPHVEYPRAGEVDDGRRMEDVYRTLVEGVGDG